MKTKLFIVLFFVALLSSLSLAWQQCTPSCPSGYTQTSSSCDWNAHTCTVQCRAQICGGSGTLVNQDDDALYWNDNDYDESDSSSAYTPQAGYCYRFGVLGSDKDTWGTGNDHNDLVTEEVDEQDDCTHDSVTSNSINAFCGIGFKSLSSSSSWLSSIDDQNGNSINFNSDTWEGWIDDDYCDPADDDDCINNINSYYDYLYFTMADYDRSGREDGDDCYWDGLSRCADNSGWHYIYCADTRQECQAWGQENCGVGCAGQGTRAWTAQGVYQHVNRDHGWEEDAFNDEGANDVTDNGYGRYSKFYVWRYPKVYQTNSQSCNMANEAPTFSNFQHTVNENANAFTVYLGSHVYDPEGDTISYTIRGQSNNGAVNCNSIVNNNYLQCQSPTAPGTNEVSIEISDPSGNRVTGIATIVVQDVYDPPTMVSVVDRPALVTAGNVVQFEGAWSNGDESDVRLRVCRSNRISGTSCINGEFCSSSLTSSGSNWCNYQTNSWEPSTTTYYAFACDNTACSSYLSSTYEINHAPVANRPSISGTYYTNDQIECRPGSITDQDGDTTSVQYYQWAINNNVVPGTTNQLNCQTTSGCDAGVTVKCYYMATDEHGLSSSWSSASNQITIQNTLPSFTVNTVIDGAGSSSSNPQEEGWAVTFRATTTDPDNQNTKLIICGSNSISGTNCNGATLCQSSLGTSSSKSCNHIADNLRTTSKPFYSFACDTNSCRSGSSGTIYYNLVRVENVRIDLDNQNLYTHTGPQVGGITPIFTTELQDFLNNCQPDEKGYCIVPLHFSAQARGKLELEDLVIRYTLQNEPPTIQQIDDITLTEGSLIGLPLHYFDPDDFNPLVTFSGPMSDTTWETSRGDAGTYQQTITISDGDLSSSTTFDIIVNPPSDLCTGVTCQDYCQGTTLNTAGTCNSANGQCEYTEIEESTSCGYVPPECLADTDCGNPRYIADAYCGTDNSIYRRQITPRCRNEVCVDEENDLLIEACTTTCQAGECIEEYVPEGFILSYSPETSMTLDEGNEQIFSVQLNNPSTHNYQISWMLDGLLVATGDSYTYQPNNNDQGLHELIVDVEENDVHEQQRWEIIVNDVTVVSRPDLEIDGLSVFYPANPVSGSMTVFIFTILNTGIEDAESVSWIFDPQHEDLDENQVSNEAITSANTVAVTSGESNQVYVPYQYSSPYTGEVFLRVIDDDGNEVDVTNNIAVRNIVVG